MAMVRRREKLRGARDLLVYQKAYTLAMEIFRLSKSWPPEERYSLTDQVQRSSRSVCANIREAWAKRRYAAHLISKLTDADGENCETDTWLEFAKDCGYLPMVDYTRLSANCHEVGAMIGGMLNDPTPFLLSARAI